mmetsp:Transcript_37821/g.67821  ORF Transcript_37821/g.67821 Transcript_37821/m.67821 type:complete len:210 (-) Transcript_37821:210-839(-)
MSVTSLELTGKPGLSQFGKILCSRRMIPVFRFLYFICTSSSSSFLGMLAAAEARLGCEPRNVAADATPTLDDARSGTSIFISADELACIPSCLGNGADAVFGFRLWRGASSTSSSSMSCSSSTLVRISPVDRWHMLPTLKSLSFCLTFSVKSSKVNESGTGIATFLRGCAPFTETKTSREDSCMTCTLGSCAGSIDTHVRNTSTYADFS